MNIENFGEFELLKKISEKFAVSHPSLIKGIGDDAAVLSCPEGKLLLFASDMLIENIHFSLNLTNSYQLGRKSLSVNISDIAAMGGDPKFFLVSLGIREDISLEFIDGFYRGIDDVSGNFGIFLAGGDLNRTNGNLVINVSLLGEVLENHLLLRSGARIGDQIFVTGTLGDSALGLEILKKKRKGGKHSTETGELIKKHLDPGPRLSEARVIAKKKIATAMIDISDGLLSDLNHIVEESRVGAKIWLDKLPLSPGFEKYAPRYSQPAIDLALKGGEDYELLFTIPPEKMEYLCRLSKNHSFRVTHIGEIIEPEGKIEIFTGDGLKYSINDFGFNHFAHTKEKRGKYENVSRIKR